MVALVYLAERHEANRSRQEMHIPRHRPSLDEDGVEQAQRQRRYISLELSGWPEIELEELWQCVYGACNL
jgi:hypothetical protein